MSDKEVISGRQLILLIFTFLTANATIYVPAFVTKNAGRDGWLPILIGGFAGILIIFAVTAIGQRFPDKTLIEYSETILGKWAGKIVGLIFILFFLYLNSIIVREMTATIHGTLLPKTSAESITIIIFIACAYSAKKGLEPIARANVLTLLMIYIAIFTVLFLLLKDINTKQLVPFLSRGILPVLQDSITAAGWFGDVICIAFLIPFINKPKEVRLHSIIGVVWAAITLAFMTALCITLFGAKLTSILTFPTLEAVRYININDYIQRLEIVFLIPWMISNYIKTCFFYYISVLIISKSFKIEKTKTLVLPIGLVIFTLSLALFKNNEDMSAISIVFGFYALPISLGIPVFLLIVELVKNKRRGKNAEKV